MINLRALVVCSVLICMAPMGCSSTLSHRKTDQLTLDKIRSISVTLSKKAQLSVRKARNEMSPVGMMFGLLGASIEAAARASSDRSQAEGVASALGQYDPLQPLSEKLQEGLASTRRFASVDAQVGENITSDALFDVQLTEWGLVRCLASGRDDDMQVAITISSRLLSHSGETLWAGEQHYRDPDCHSLEGYKSQPEVLQAAITKGLEEIASRAVSDILYP